MRKELWRIEYTKKEKLRVLYFCGWAWWLQGQLAKAALLLLKVEENTKLPLLFDPYVHHGDKTRSIFDKKKRKKKVFAPPAVLLTWQRAGQKMPSASI